jgi:hypothetical protein
LSYKKIQMNKKAKILIGIVLGVAVFGGIYYFYKKRKVEKPLTIDQKDNRTIVIINTDK